MLKSAHEWMSSFGILMFAAVFSYSEISSALADPSPSPSQSPTCTTTLDPTLWYLETDTPNADGNLTLWQFGYPGGVATNYAGFNIVSAAEPTFSSAGIIVDLPPYNSMTLQSGIESVFGYVSAGASMSAGFSVLEGTELYCLADVDGPSQVQPIPFSNFTLTTPSSTGVNIVCSNGGTSDILLQINPVTVDAACPQPSPSPSPTLSIDPESVIISQAVNSFVLPGQSDITLVQGKNAAVLATVYVTNPIPNDQTTMTLTVTMPDGTVATSSAITMANIDPDAGLDVTVSPIAVNSSTQGTITVQATAADAISSAQIPEVVVVKQTNPLGIVYHSTALVEKRALLVRVLYKIQPNTWKRRRFLSKIPFPLRMET